MKKMPVILVFGLLMFICSGCATAVNIKTGYKETVVKSDAITPVEITSAMAGLVTGYFLMPNSSDMGARIIVTLGSGMFFYGIGSMVLSNSYKTDYRNDYITYGILSGFVLGTAYGVYEGIELSKTGPYGIFTGVLFGLASALLGPEIGAGLGNIAGHIADIVTGTTGNEGRAN